MRPLDVPEILIIERDRQGALLVLEAVDRAMFGIEDWSIAGIPDCGAHQARYRQCRGDRVGRSVDRAMLVKMGVREIEGRVPENRLGKARMVDQLRAEDRHRLEVCVATPLDLMGAQPAAYVVDERSGTRWVSTTMRRVDLVPDVPGEQGRAAAPSIAREGQAVLDRGTHLGTSQPLSLACTYAAIRTIIGMVPPPDPHEEGVVGRQQHAQPDLLEQFEQVIPELHHVRHEAAHRPLEIAVIALAVFQHQPNAGDAMVTQPDQVALDGAAIAAAEQRR